MVSSLFYLQIYCTHFVFLSFNFLTDSPVHFCFLQHVKCFVSCTTIDTVAIASNSNAMPLFGNTCTNSLASMNASCINTCTSVMLLKHLEMVSHTSFVNSVLSNVLMTSTDPSTSSLDSLLSTPVIYLQFLSLMICNTSCADTSLTAVSNAPTC